MLGRNKLCRCCILILTRQCQDKDGYSLLSCFRHLLLASAGMHLATCSCTGMHLATYSCAGMHIATCSCAGMHLATCSCAGMHLASCSCAPCMCIMLDSGLLTLQLTDAAKFCPCRSELLAEIHQLKRELNYVTVSYTVFQD